jgi:penicillin-binding protein 1A
MQQPQHSPYSTPQDGGFSGGEQRPRRSIFKKRTRRRSFALGVIVNAFRMSMLMVLLLGLAGIGVVVGIAKAYVETAPVLDIAKIDDQAQTSFFYDAKGNLITDYKGTENRIMVSIDTMPQQLRYAFVAVEDARFYSHNGVDIKRIIGAFITNFVSGSQQGGSTITQQLIKNTVLTDELSYKRKIQEAYLAMQLESRYTKDEILESYLNTIYLGENYYGVKVAATGYFGKELNQLTLRECAMLAGMTTNPYHYNARRNFYLRSSPNVDYPAITNNRTNYVLRMMYENQFITHAQYTQALEPSTATVLRESPAQDTLYPYVHYVEYAVRDVVRTLLKINSLEDNARNRAAMERELRTGGYKVYLALDTEIQKTVEDALYNYKDYPALRDPGDKIYRARNSDGTYEEIQQPQAAACVIDYRTGELKAIVGSRMPPTQRKTLNRATDMNMPVGSSIKPISVFAPAIELGASPASIAYNMPIPIAGWRGADGKDTWPKNYGGANYRGPETLRTALVKSDNTATAQAMMTYVGVERSADFLLRMGVDKAHLNNTPFGLALGSSGLTPLEMATAFGVLGNGGVYQEPISFLGITDASGKVVYDSHAQQQRRQVFKPSTAWMTVDMMKEAVQKGTGTSARISGQTVAGKTGTNSEQRGVFFSGMTGWYAGAVWIGHDNYKPLSSRTTGGNSAAKLWKEFMQDIHNRKGLQNRDILEGSPEQYGLVRATTCAVSGQLATDACRQDAMGYGTVTDYWALGTVPTVNCQMHRTTTICTASNMLAGTYCPAESLATRGVVVLPQGHPLQAFVNTSYASVLTDYLGHFVAGGDPLSAAVCNMHGPQTQFEVPYISQSLVPDAYALVTAASQQLAALTPTHPMYMELMAAIDGLNQAIAQAPDSQEMVNAMARLTQAMASAQ